MNVSPMGDGSLQPELIERLNVIKEWMACNGESIVGTRAGLTPWHFYGPSTRRDNRVYLHLLMQPYDTITVRGVPIKHVRAVRALASGIELRYTTRSNILDALANPDPLGEVTIEVPAAIIDPYATVIAVDFA